MLASLFHNTFYTLLNTDCYQLIREPYIRESAVNLSYKHVAGCRTFLLLSHQQQQQQQQHQYPCNNNSNGIIRSECSSSWSSSLILKKPVSPSTYTRQRWLFECSIPTARRFSFFHLSISLPQPSASTLSVLLSP